MVSTKTSPPRPAFWIGLVPGLFQLGHCAPPMRTGSRKAAVVGTAMRAVRLAVASVTLVVPCLTSAADTQISVSRIATLPAAPQDAAWNDIAPTRVALIPQDMVEPRQLESTTPEVRVRAYTDGSRMAFLLEWPDSTDDDMTKPAQFSDACAVQLPAVVAADVPAPQMGEPGRQVEVTYWRAVWQAAVDGRPDTIRALYPDASVDHYPFEAPALEKGSPAQREMERRYAPARAVGNDMAGPRQRPVEDLIAEGPGTLSPAAKQDSSGKGVRTARGWTVMLVRSLPAGFVPGKRSQVAFAVWDGARDEVGARKMRSVWVTIALKETP